MDSLTKKVISQLDERVVQFMNKYVLSGLALGVVKDGELIFAKGYGIANAGKQEAVTPDSVFRIASISKTFTALGVLQLWEQGKFQLDDPINQHLRSYKVLHPDPNAPAVTIRHMLTHTSGIGEMRDIPDLIKALVNPNHETIKPGEPIPPLAEYYHGVLSPDVYPAQKWAYANHAYNTLQQLIEDVSGQPFAQYMIEHVFEPLGMYKTDYLLSDRVRHELAQGYGFEKGRLKPREYMFFEGMGAGTVHSSVNQMALYLAALENGGANQHGSIIKPETLQMMMTPQYSQHPHLGAMGLGYFIEDLDGHKAAWHGGALPGFNSSMWVAPEDKVGLIVWANTETRAIYNFGESILRSLLGLPDYETRLPVKGILNSSHLWPEMTGTYGPLKGLNTNARVWLMLGGEVEVLEQKGKLILRSMSGPFAKGVELFPVDPNDPLVFENVSDGKLLRLAFQRNSSGVIDRISFSNLSFYTLYKRSKTQSVRFLTTVVKIVLGALGALIVGSFIFKKKPCCKK